MAIESTSWRIGEVVAETGISKQLVHHYMRHGLVPPSRQPGRYTGEQVRLLRQIRVLRDDHNLPLEDIRRLFEICGFDAERIETLTSSESLCKRITRLVTRGELLAADTPTAAQLAVTAGIGDDAVAEYVAAGIATPVAGAGEQRFSAYDAGAIALCEYGRRIGIPLDAFRTIASYTRIAFDLVHDDFYGVATGSHRTADDVLADLFVRRELAGGFVQAVLSGLTQQRMRELVARSATGRAALDDVVYAPSAAFLRKHGIPQRIAEAMNALRRPGADARAWLRAGELLLHAGRPDEAVFVLEEARRAFPERLRLADALGRALVLSGDLDRGAEVLADAERPGGDPRTPVFRALAVFERACADGPPEALLGAAAGIRQRVEDALTAAAGAPDGVRLAVAIYGGWLLTALPALCTSYDRGRGLLVDALAELDTAPLADAGMPGLRDRYRINTAYLLWECAVRDAAPPRPGEPPAEALRALICRLDPGSAFAEAAYLDGPGNHRDQGRTAS